MKKRRRKSKNTFRRFMHELCAIGGQSPIFPMMAPPKERSEVTVSKRDNFLLSFDKQLSSVVF